MSWFHDNKFLAIFGGGILVAAGALGYFTMSASSKYDEAKTKFDEASGKLTSLYASKPFPQDENVKLYQKRQEEVKAQIGQLQAKLAAIKLKTDKPSDVSPNLFQDKLKESVVKLTQKAKDMDGNLYAEFYYGFESYKDKPPVNNEAAAALLKELRAMELVSDLVFQVKGVEVKSWKREELKEEQKAPESSGKNAKAQGPEKEKKLIRKAGFTIHMTTSQSHFILLLNGISSHDKQIFVVRNLQVTNSVQDSPPKVKLSSGGPADVPKPGEKASETGLETVFGQERVLLELDIDICDVADPEVAAAPTPAKGNSKSK